MSSERFHFSGYGMMHQVEALNSLTSERVILQ